MSRRSPRTSSQPRWTPSRVKPAFSATRWEAVFSTSACSWSPLGDGVLDHPPHEQDQCPRRDAAASLRAGDPVAELGALGLEPAEATAAEQLAGLRVEGADVPRSLGVPLGLVGDELAPVLVRVRERDHRQPVVERLVVAGLDERRQVVHGPRSQGHDAVRQLLEQLHRLGDQISLRSAAQRVSSCRDESWSFRRTFDTWASTVFTDRWSRAAISL